MASIINLSDAVSIGIHSMVIVAKSDTPVNAIQLSEKLYKSKHHIAKVMQRLVKVGFLDSFRGPTGGFIINVDPSELYLYDIYKAIEGDIHVKECKGEGELCPLDKCIYNNLAAKLTAEFVAYFKSQTIKDYM